MRKFIQTKTHTDRHIKLRTTISWVASSSEKSLFLSNNHISRDHKWIFFMKLDVVNKIKRVWSQTQIFAQLKQRQAPGAIIIIHTINREIVNISTTIFEMHCFFCNVLLVSLYNHIINFFRSWCKIRLPMVLRHWFVILTTTQRLFSWTPFLDSSIEEEIRV